MEKEKALEPGSPVRGVKIPSQKIYYRNNFNEETIRWSILIFRWNGYIPEPPGRRLCRNIYTAYDMHLYHQMED